MYKWWARSRRTYKPRLKVLLVFISFGLLITIILYQVRYFREHGSAINILGPGEKLILGWTTVFGGDTVQDWEFLGFKPSGPACPHKCKLTTDKSLLNSSHAILYHGYPEGGQMYPLPKPAVRNPNQVWIYFALEPPDPFYSIYETIGDHYDFNWTLTYRLDSDIVFQYGKFVKVLNPNISELPKGKKFVTGLLSNCKTPSGRSRYIAELQKGVRVDIYGKCGNDSCSKAGGTDSCHRQLARQYKFWLAFENSLCADYVTEKFYLPLRYGSVPIYYGDPKGVAHAPPKSYINVHDYGSPGALAKYLTQLNQNPAEYEKYFDWRRTHEVQRDSFHWCDLCTKLHGLDRESGSLRKAYRSMADWILRNNSHRSVCSRPPKF